MSRLMLISAASLAALTLAACGDNNDDLATNDTMANDTAMSDTATVDTAANDPEASIREGQEFVNAAGQAGMVEIRTSEMALEKAQSPEVKAFAQKMIDDHTAANEKLMAAATAAALAPPPATLDDFHMRRINDLVETDGNEDFDADYMALQVDAHNDAIGVLEGYADNANAIPQLKMFADENLPAMQAHKADAERIRDMVNDDGKADTANPS
jgi:putative membrane protein